MAREKICGIYQIRNLVNGKVYIGSSFDIKKRWWQHKNNLKRMAHGNSHLQRAWNKYGKENFTFEIIEIIKKDSEIPIREQWCLDNVVKWGFDYNIAKDVIAVMKGRRASNETKKKMSDSRKGVLHSQETKEKLSEIRRGKNHPQYGKRGKDSHNWKRKKSEKEKQATRDRTTGIKRSKKTSSKYIRVTWDKSRGKWKVSVRVSGKDKYVGRFKDEVVAAQSYDLASMKYHDGKYPVNFPKLKEKYRKLISQGIIKITEEIK